MAPLYTDELVDLLLVHEDVFDVVAGSVEGCYDLFALLNWP